MRSQRKKLAFLIFSEWSEKRYINASEGEGGEYKNKISFNFVFESIPERMTRSTNPPVRPQAGCWASQLHPSPLRCSVRARPQLQALEQIDHVGENDQAYDGKEHQNENIQHGGVLGRGGLRMAGKCEL